MKYTKCSFRMETSIQNLTGLKTIHSKSNSEEMFHRLQVKNIQALLYKLSEKKCK